MDPILCRLFGHKYNGCRCQRCGSTREEGHTFRGCKCAVCGKVREEGHTFRICNCYACTMESATLEPDRRAAKYCHRISCLRNRDSYKKECLHICTQCGTVLFTAHKMVPVPGKCYSKCTVCGYCSNPKHSWEGCRCTRCGDTRDREHTFIREGCRLICRNCGKTLESHSYRFIGQNVSYGTGKCPTVYASDSYRCNFCDTPEACLKYPRRSYYSYACTVCGKRSSSDDLIPPGKHGEDIYS